MRPDNWSTANTFEMLMNKSLFIFGENIKRLRFTSFGCNLSGFYSTFSFSGVPFMIWVSYSSNLKLAYCNEIALKLLIGWLAVFLAFFFVYVKAETFGKPQKTITRFWSKRNGDETQTGRFLGQ